VKLQLVCIVCAVASFVGKNVEAGEERRYAVIIGYNGAPATNAEDSNEPLRYADDDALAFYRLRKELGDRVIVLSSPDTETRRRFPDAAEVAEPPTLAALDRAVALISDALQADRRAGRTTVFSFFYSGHGGLDLEGRSALTLLGSGLTRQMFYEHVLDRAVADVVHVFIDACHAESVARPRDLQAVLVPLSPSEVADYLSRNTLQGYPQVGVALASNLGSVSHEWDKYQLGIFTFELLSGLRGAADVNGDRRVDYSELAAFLSAANREVEDPRARLQTIVSPPSAFPWAPLSDFSHAQESARLTGIPAGNDSVWIEDAFGNRLAEGRPELGFLMSV
jgi:hypothetical protein